MASAQYRVIRIANVSEIAVKPRLSGSLRYVAIPTKGIPLAIRWSYLLFIFTLPFDATDLGFMTGSLSVAKIAGLVFFALYFVYYGLLSSERSFAHPPRAMWWFFIYVVIFALSSLTGPVELGTDLSSVFTLVQLIVFFWFTSDLLKNQKIARHVLLTYAIATFVVALGIVGASPGFSTDVGGGRVEVFGDNPNATGQHIALAALILIGLTINGAFKWGRTSKVLLPLLMIVLLAGMVATGSRSAAVALVIGCSAYLFPHLRSRRILTSGTLATLVIAGVVYMIASNPYFMERWQATYYDQDWAGRQDIYGAAIDMISERPILGWIPVRAFYELGRRVGWSTGRDTHNLLFDLLIGVGFIGAIPFLIGLCLCVWAAWNARTGAWGMLPVALITANLIASMSHTNLTWKPQWFVFAITCAAASSVLRRSEGTRQPCFLRTELPNRPDLRKEATRVK